MRRYLRSHTGSVYFFTLVTHERRPILTTQLGRRRLREALRWRRLRRPFAITASVLLPDHLQAVLEFVGGDVDYSTRWRLIKGQFSRLWRARSGGGAENVESGNGGFMNIPVEMKRIVRGASTMST